MSSSLSIGAFLSDLRIAHAIGIGDFGKLTWNQHTELKASCFEGLAEPLQPSPCGISSAAALAD
jgi:hypothetical protein